MWAQIQKPLYKAVLEVHRYSFEHLDWQLMGFHEFSKLDLRMMHSGRKRTDDCGKWFGTPWIHYRTTVFVLQFFSLPANTAHQAAAIMGNWIVIFFSSDFKSKSLIEKSCSFQFPCARKKNWKRVMKQVEFNSIERDSSVELKSIKLLEKLDEELIFLAVAVQLKLEEKSRDFMPVWRCGREFSRRF